MSGLVYILQNGGAGVAVAQAMLGKTGISTKTFGSASALFEAFEAGQAGCIVADSEPHGTALLTKFRQHEIGVPVILASEKPNVESAVRALRNGAFDYLEVPFTRKRLVDSIHQALGLCFPKDENEPVWSETRSRLERLSIREQEVLELVVHGNTNRVIAKELQLSPKTIEIHRSRVMRKMEAPSLAHLVATIRCFQCARWPGPAD